MIKHTLYLIILLTYISLKAQKQPEVVITTGHSTLITNVKLSPTGKYAATNSANHLIKIWEISSGKEICTLNNKNPEHVGEERIQDMMFTDNGKNFLTIDENGKINVWDIKKEMVIHTFHGITVIPGMALDNKANKIAFLNKEFKLTIADLDNFKIKTYDNIKGTLVKFNAANKNEVFVVNTDKEFFLFDLEKNEKIKQFEKTNAHYFKFTVSNKGNYVAVGLTTGEIKIWSIRTGKLLKTLINYKAHTILAHPKTDDFIILDADIKDYKTKIKILNSRTFEEKRVIDDAGLIFSLLSISKSGDFMAVNSFENDGRNMIYTIKLIDWKTGKVIKNLKSRAKAISQILVSNKTPHVAVLSRDLNLRIWNIENQQIEQVVPYVQSAAMNKSGNILALYGNHEIRKYQPSILFWDIDSLKYKFHIPEQGIIYDMQFSADNKHIIVSDLQGKIKIWDYKSKKLVKQLQGYIGGQSVDISPDFKYVVATTSGTAGIKIFDIEKDTSYVIKEAHKYVGGREIRFSSDGKYLLTGGFDAEVNILETGTWLKVKELPDNKGPVTSVVFNQANSKLAAATMGSTVKQADYSVNVWNTATGNQICNLLGHNQNVWAVAFHETKNLIFSGGDDGMLKIWDLDGCNEIASCISINYDDYIIVTPDYYYSGSRDALLGVGFKINGTQLHPFEQYDLRLNRPDIIAKKIGVASPELIKAFERAYRKRLQKMGFNKNMLKNEFVLPQIFVENRSAIDFKTTKNNLSFKITAKDEKNNLDRINVWINNVPVYGRTGIDIKDKKKKEISKNINIELSEGKNKIQVSVLNEKGIESLKETFVVTNQQKQEKHDLYLVAIGISDYINDDYDLKYAAKDAKDLIALFNSKPENFNNIHVKSVLNHDATRENILSVKDFLKKSSVNDVAVIFVAGHGLLDEDFNYYLATTDIDAMNPADRGLLYENFENLLDDIPARKKLILIDACHSGEVDNEFETEEFEEYVVAENTRTTRSVKSKISFNNSFKLMKDLFADLRRGCGAVVISSAGGEEYAYESPKFKNGIFTYVILDGLKSRKIDLNVDLKVNISELRDYVIKRVSKITRGNQNPTSRRENLEFDFKIW